MDVVLDPFGPTRRDLDRTILDYFEAPPEGITLRTEGLRRASRRRLNGGAIVVYDEEHWRHKRGHAPRAPDHADMHGPFDNSNFNFNKVDAKEVIARVRLQGAEHRLLTNISPLMVGHVVVALHCERGLPQGSLGADGVRCMMELAAMSARQDFRVVYNSLGAFASVNHLHVHGMYVAGLDGNPETDCLPLETAPRRPLAAFGAVRVSAVEPDAARGLGMRAFAVEGPPVFVAEVAGQCVEQLHRLRVPHNLLVRASGGPKEPAATFLVVPRQPQENFDVPAAGCNAAVCEVCGFLVMQSAEAYGAQSAASVAESFAAGASLSASAFSALSDHLADTLRWRRCGRLRGADGGAQGMLALAGGAALLLAALAAARGR